VCEGKRTTRNEVRQASERPGKREDRETVAQKQENGKQENGKQETAVRAKRGSEAQHSRERFQLSQALVSAGCLSRGWRLALGSPIGTALAGGNPAPGQLAYLLDASDMALR